ncbi:MAG: HAD family phosphatase [Verrucomicrobiales bacterium]
MPETIPDPRALAPFSIPFPERDFAAYIFDCDGTVIDSMPLHYRAWQGALAAHQAPYSLPVERFLRMGGIPTREIVGVLNAEFGGGPDPLEVAATKSRLYLEGLREVEPIAEMVGYLQDLRGRGKPMAIGTGGTREVVVESLRHTGLLELFDLIVTPADVGPGRGKPQPDLFLLAAEKLGAPPAETVVFEDAEPGFLAAIAAGMHLVKVPPSPRFFGG